MEIFFRENVKFEMNSFVEIAAIVFCAISVDNLALAFASLMQPWPTFFVEAFEVLPTLAFAVLIFVMATGGGFISNAVLSNRIVVWLGETIFILYLVHQLIIRYLKSYNTLMPYPAFVQFCAFVAIIAFFTTAVHYLVEIRITTLVKKVIRRHKTETSDGKLTNLFAYMKYWNRKKETYSAPVLEKVSINEASWSSLFCQTPPKPDGLSVFASEIPAKFVTVDSSVPTATFIR